MIVCPRAGNPLVFVSGAGVAAAAAAWAGLAYAAAVVVLFAAFRFGTALITGRLPPRAERPAWTALTRS
jgi:hypothetical protein